MAPSSQLHQQVGFEVVDDVGVRRRSQQTDAGARGLLPHVERHHLRQRAVERGGELVAGDERRAGGQCVRQPEAKRSPSLNSPGVRSNSRASPRPQPVRIARRSAIGPRRASISGTSGNLRVPSIESTELSSRGAEQDDFPDPLGPGEQHHVAGADIEREVLRDRVRRFNLAEAEQIGNLPGRERTANGPEIVADRDGREHGRARGWGSTSRIYPLGFTLSLSVAFPPGIAGCPRRCPSSRGRRRHRTRRRRCRTGSRPGPPVTPRPRRAASP